MLLDGFFNLILGQAVRIVPTLLVCIIGIVMLQKQVPAGKVRTYGISGLLLFVLGSVCGVAFGAYLMMGGADYASSSYRLIQVAYGAFSQVVHAVAIVLLIMAICKKAQVSVEKNETENPYV